MREGEKKGAGVTHRTKGNRMGKAKAGDLASEPGVVELSRMVERGELSRRRLAKYLRGHRST